MNLIKSKKYSHVSRLDNLIRRLEFEFNSSTGGKIWCDFISKNLNHSYQPIKQFYTDLPQNSKIVEIGCSNAVALRDILSHQSFKSHGIGIDISLKSLKDGLHSSNMSSSKIYIDFIQADANYLPLRHNSCDGILFKNVIHHLQNFDCLSQINAIAKEGSRLLIIDQPGGNPFKFIGRKLALLLNIKSFGEGETFLFFTPLQLKLALSNSGFEVVNIKNRDFFFRRLFEIFLLISPLRQYISKRLLFSLYMVEKKIEKKNSFDIFSSSVILYSIKKSILKKPKTTARSNSHFKGSNN